MHMKTSGNIAIMCCFGACRWLIFLDLLVNGCMFLECHSVALLCGRGWVHVCNVSMWHVLLRTVCRTIMIFDEGRAYRVSEKKLCNEKVPSFDVN